MRIPIITPIFTLAVIALAGCALAPTLAAPTAAPVPTNAPATSAPTATVAPTALPLVKVHLAYSAIAAPQLPLWVAFDQHLFQKYGLDPTLDYISTNPLLTTALISGDVQIAQLAEDGIINSGLQGADLVIIAPSTDHLLFSLFTRPEITKLSELKGKKIGVTTRGSATDFAARWLLSHNGFKPDTDVAIVGVGGVPEILTALSAGSIDGGILSAPTTIKAQQAGLKELVDLSTQDLPFYQSAVTVRKSWLKDNADTMRKFLKAYTEAIAVIKKDKLVAEQVLGKYTQTTDTAVLEGTYNPFVKVLPQVPLPRIDAINVGLDEIAASNSKAVGVDANQFIDPTWVSDLAASGFIAALYK
jgi:ABC-type nitrate/sulfonate/bicarbonate transport system substrate-binding protein